MRAIVLAAGKGTRLLREGDDFPKAMKPLCGKPILSYVLKSLNFFEYQTDVTSILQKRGIPVTTQTIRDDVQIIGVNNEEDLELCSKYI
jgi:bifunctional N-acetylglucosamine-1-phosphate-uridyltransferase/glucosamine-1-phosphate-acetyltransferase GlmU-like protein